MKPASEHGNDIESLLEHLGKTPLRYADIQGHEAGRRAIEQWPLLARLRGIGDAPAAAQPERAP